MFHLGVDDIKTFLRYMLPPSPGLKCVGWFFLYAAFVLRSKVFKGRRGEIWL
jgi:hypothetical protein